MARNLDDVLFSSGVIPSIPAGEVRDVQAGLLLNGQAVAPHLVDVDGPCLVIAKHANGRFSVWNCSDAQLDNIPWKAKISISMEQSPLVDGVADVVAGSVPAPALLSGAVSFLDLTDTPATYVGQGTAIVQVNPGETGLQFLPLSNVLEGITYSWADAAARAAQVGMVDGELGVQRDTGDVYRYNDPPGSWSVFFNLGDGAPPSGFWAGTADQIAYIAPNHPDAADDLNVATPFVTFAGCNAAIGRPVDIPTQEESWAVYVAPGEYDEDVTVPAARRIHYYTFGSVVIGTLTTAKTGVATVRNVAYEVDGNLEFAGIRPSVGFSRLEGGHSETTQQSGANGFWITGNLYGLDIGGDPNTTVDMVLHSVRVEEQLGGLLDTHPSALNLFAKRCRFNDGEAVGSCIDRNVLFQAFRENRCSSDVIASRFNRVTKSDFRGDVTFSAGYQEDVAPGGMYDCKFANASTITAPAGAFAKADNTTVANAISAAAVFAGGVLLNDAKNFAFAYVPAVPGNWGPVPTNIWDALDQLAAGGGGGGLNLAPTFVVGSSDAGDTASDCDFLHTNNANPALPPTVNGFANAVNAAIAAGGGLIYVRRGTYYTDVSHNINVPGVTIIGEGRDTNIIHNDVTATTYFLSLGANECEIRRLNLHAASYDAPGVFRFIAVGNFGVKSNLLDDVWFYPSATTRLQANGSVVQMLLGSETNIMTNCVIDPNESGGFISGDGTPTSAIKMQGERHLVANNRVFGHVADATTALIIVGAQYTRVSGNYSKCTNTSLGYAISNISSYNTITGNECEGGILLDNGFGDITANVVRLVTSCNVGISLNRAGIGGASSVNVVSNFIHASSGARKGISQEGSGQTHTISGNTVTLNGSGSVGIQVSTNGLVSGNMILLTGANSNGIITTGTQTGGTTIVGNVIQLLAAANSVTFYGIYVGDASTVSAKAVISSNNVYVNDAVNAIGIFTTVNSQGTCLGNTVDGNFSAAITHTTPANWQDGLNNVV